MPFKSEKQRRYLFANEPEIAKDWADTYGSRIQKNTGGITRIPFQGGGADASTTSFSKSYDKMHGTNTQSRANKAVDRRQAEGQKQADKINEKIAASELGKTQTANTIAAIKAAQQTPFVHPTRKTLYNIFPNNPKNELAYISRLKFQNPKAYAQLPAALKAKFEELQLDEDQDLLDTATTKFSFDDFEALRTFDPTKYDSNAIDFAEYAAKYKGAPGLKYAGNVGNLETYVKGVDEFGNKIYDYREKTGGGGGRQEPQFPFIPGGPGDDDPDDGDPGDGGGGGTGGTVYPYASYGTPGYETSKTFMDIAYPGGSSFLLARGGRVPAAFGGIMDTNTGRRGYFLGSIKDAFKGVAKAAGKVLKSPIGMAAAGYFLGGGGIGSFKGWGGKGFGNSPLAMSRFFQKNIAEKGMPFKAGGFDPLKTFTTLSPLLAFTSLADAPKQETLGGGGGGGKLTDPITKQKAVPAEMVASLENALDNADGNPDKIAAIRAAYRFLSPDQRLGQYYPYEVKDGGRIPAQEGGLMDLGGMEKDYRNNGGFVAIGGEERADDVPARLSRNEFVFTADAVRNAGGGDIDKGAEIMENVMENLEQGGQISKETQGNTGAQEMFSVSERLGEVL